eukprot:scaffold47886_cov37-Tisochrysis_lutea.AAC.6
MTITTQLLNERLVLVARHECTVYSIVDTRQPASHRSQSLSVRTDSSGLSEKREATSCRIADARSPTEAFAKMSQPLESKR